MECRLCGHSKTHKYGKIPNGPQRYFCPQCQQTFSESFDTLYYYRHVRREKIQQVLQAHSEGTSLRGISRISRLTYHTVVRIVRASRARALLVHNDPIEQSKIS
jgi:transposase-like protein